MTAGRRPPRARARKNAVDPTFVLLEDIRAQNKIVLEAVVTLDEKMERNIAALRTEMSERGDLLEASVRTLSGRAGGIDTRLGGIDTRLDRIDDQLTSLRQEGRDQAALWARKADAAALAALDQRVTALERSARI